MRRPLIALMLAATPAAAYEPSAPVAYLKDITTGAVLFARGADERIPPASMGKMMTVYLAFEMVKSGRARLDQKIVVRPETWRAWHSQGSTMFLGVGEQPTLEQLLHGIVTLSGNDACVVLAEGLAGTEANYVTLMNQTAARMGLKGSRFANTTGWPDDAEWVTARDLATLAERTITDHPALYRQFYGKKDFTWGKTLGKGAAITQPNRNPLIGRVTGADGLKTGHTEAAGYGFTGSATQDGRRLVMVVAGLSSFNERIAQSVGFIDWGFRAFEALPVAKRGQAFGTAPVAGGEERAVTMVAPRDLAVSVPRGQQGAKVSARPLAGLQAPIAAGARVGELLVVGPKGTQRLPLVASVAVPQAGPLGQALGWLRGLFGG